MGWGINSELLADKKFSESVQVVLPDVDEKLSIGLEVDWEWGFIGELWHR